MSAESEGDVAAELGTNCNLGKTMELMCPAWRCPHQCPKKRRGGLNEKEKKKNFPFYDFRNLEMKTKEIEMKIQGELRGIQ